MEHTPNRDLLKALQEELAIKEDHWYKLDADFDYLSDSEVLEFYDLGDRIREIKKQISQLGRDRIREIKKQISQLG